MNTRTCATAYSGVAVTGASFRVGTARVQQICSDASSYRYRGVTEVGFSDGPDFARGNRVEHCSRPAAASLFASVGRALRPFSRHDGLYDVNSHKRYGYVDDAHVGVIQWKERAPESDIRLSIGTIARCRGSDRHHTGCRHRPTDRSRAFSDRHSSLACSARPQ
jgi:hypothetical protein